MDTSGRAHQLRRWAEYLTTAELVGTKLVGRRNRMGAIASALALLAGSALQRFGVFEAGVARPKTPNTWLSHSANASTRLTGEEGLGVGAVGFQKSAGGSDAMKERGLRSFIASEQVSEMDCTKQVAIWVGDDGVG